MKIKKLTAESCKLLLQNLNENFGEIKSNYLSHDRDFKSLTLGMGFIDQGSYNIDEKFEGYDSRINLKLDNSGIHDFENAKFIFEAFEGLTPIDANDERLWVRLTHEHCHKYMVERWMKGKEERTLKNIIERFFLNGSGQQTRVRNGIARLWWIAYLTVQQSEQDEDEKWKYTKVICESQDFITSILERTMGTYPNVRFGVLEFYMENKEAFENAKSKKIQQILRDLNNHGGVTLLPLLSKEEVKSICAKLMPIRIEE
jgi:hypothetical protein